MKQLSKAALEKAHITLLAVLIAGIGAKVWEKSNSGYAVITFYHINIWGKLFLLCLAVSALLASYIYLQYRFHNNFLKYLVVPGILLVAAGYAIKTYHGYYENEVMFSGIGLIALFESLSHIGKKKAVSPPRPDSVQ